MEFVSIDFETANEKRDSACAIGIAVVQGDAVVHQESHLIRPAELRFASWNTRIHGIKSEDVIDAPTLPDLWPSILVLMRDRLVVAHNAAFDMSVLRQSLAANNIEIPSIQYLCSLKVARCVWPALASHKLNMVAAHLGIHLEHHDAGSDARAAADIVVRAGKEAGVACPHALADRLDVSLGRLSADGDWVPSSSSGGWGPRKVELTIEGPDEKSPSSHPLHGKSVCFTGALVYFSRHEAREIVQLYGGVACDSVSRKTDYLVCGVQDLAKLAEGRSQSSKLRKALQLQEKGDKIEIISDKEFQDLVHLRVNDDASDEAF